MPALTTLAQVTSLCRSVVSSTSTPSLMAPPTPSLLPFTFLGDVVRSSSGGGATYPFRVSFPPQKLARRKPRPHRICQCHGPRAPNQVEPLLCGLIGLALFFAGDVIGHALPTNLLVMDGTKLGVGDFVSRSMRLTLLQFFSSSQDCFS
jgi:hypothetical protein